MDKLERLGTAADLQRPALAVLPAVAHPRQAEPAHPEGLPLARLSPIAPK